MLSLQGDQKIRGSAHRFPNLHQRLTIEFHGGNSLALIELASERITELNVNRVQPISNRVGNDQHSESNSTSDRLT